jgi:hypothetical protein
MNQKISGLYKGVFFDPSERKSRRIEMELRVDVDGKRPLNVVSGDLYSILNKTRRYVSSFRFEEVEKVKIARNEVLVAGKLGKFDPESNYFSDIKVAISTHSLPFTANVQWINSLGEIANHLCNHKSKYFRSVHLEHDIEEGVVPFEYYNPAELLSESASWARPISVVSAFAEAGIEITLVKKKRGAIPHPEIILQEGSFWTGTKLNAAIPKHFRSLSYKPRWKLWLFSALNYAIPNAKGFVLFCGGKRIGCAVFQNATGWQSAIEKRMRLFVYIHEIGHCFNLPHAWVVPEGSSLAGDGYATLSWMNYPSTYYASEACRGRDAFWKLFRFQFSDLELLHLRHAFRNDIILGGRNFKKSH